MSKILTQILFMRICLLSLLFACSCDALLIQFKRRLALLALPFAFSMPLTALANVDVDVPASISSSSSSSSAMTFSDFVVDLEAGKFTKVVFKGVSPTYLTAYRASGGGEVVVEEGFPAFDDPKSPSGPTQAIAKCQHTPGVVCLQDISELLQKTKRGAGSTTSLRPMLQHASYPNELEYGK